ncbi:MAG: hypothetical protein HWE16_12890 [Gammaproteobacteria bacterium]|nr:hypothetical protein [Gammaproteobacteria bacterium]
MENVLIAVIAASASIIVASITYLFSKSKEREADWRKKKLEMYHELFSAISGIVDGDSTPEAQKQFAKSTNTLGLIASVDVIEAMQELRVATKPENREKHDEVLTKFIIAVRKDMGLPLSVEPNFTYTLWSSGVKKK